MKSFTIKIPTGIRNGEKIRLMGQGKPGENGGKSGDLLIKIIIENDEKYALKGIELYTNLYLTPWEAALGTKVELPTIDDPVSLYVPQFVFVLLNRLFQLVHHDSLFPGCEWFLRFVLLVVHIKILGHQL